MISFFYITITLFWFHGTLTLRRGLCNDLKSGTRGAIAPHSVLHCSKRTILWSLFAPSMNSSMLSRPSLFRSICGTTGFGGCQDRRRTSTRTHAHAHTHARTHTHASTRTHAHAHAHAHTHAYTATNGRLTCRNILSVRNSGVDSSAGIFITEPTIL